MCEGGREREEKTPRAGRGVLGRVDCVVSGRDFALFHPDLGLAAAVIGGEVGGGPRAPSLRGAFSLSP